MNPTRHAHDPERFPAPLFGYSRVWRRHYFTSGPLRLQWAEERCWDSQCEICAVVPDDMKGEFSGRE